MCAAGLRAFQRQHAHNPAVLPVVETALRRWATDYCTLLLYIACKDLFIKLHYKKLTS